MAMKTYTRMSEFKSEEINFTLGADRHGKPQITMYYNPNASEVALVSPTCVTNWPRVTGDGNMDAVANSMACLRNKQPIRTFSKSILTLQTWRARPSSSAHPPGTPRIYS